MASNNGGGREIRLLFVDDGEFHTVTVTIPTETVERYDRLVDLLREDPEVTRRLYVDMRRLVTASVVE